MKIEKATRKAIPFIGCFYGKSGGGKTYSAIKLGQGLVAGEKVCLIDTENGRASHYADEFDNLFVLNLEPPFTPARYVEAIKLAEKEGFGVIIVDSISHEWDGIGGCLEMAEGKNGLVAWAKPKSEHRKLMNYLLQTKIHVILCARAKDDVEQVKIGGKSEIVNKGLIPIQERNFPFEMLTIFRMSDKGGVFLEKCIKSLEPLLNIDENTKITEKHGKIIKDWIDGATKIDLDSKRLRTEAREIAMSEGSEALKQWYCELSDEMSPKAENFDKEFKLELTRLAKETDQQNGRIETSQKFFKNEPSFGGLAKAVDEDMKEIQREINEKHFDKIKAALTDLGSVSELEGVWGNFKKEINKLAKYAPDLHAELVAVAKREKAKLLDDSVISDEK